MNREQDHRIDAVLQAFGRKDPSPALHARLLAAVRQAEEAESSSPLTGGRLPRNQDGWQITSWLSIAALMLAGVGTAMLLHRPAHTGSKAGPKQAMSVLEDESAPPGTYLRRNPDHRPAGEMLRTRRVLPNRFANNVGRSVSAVHGGDPITPAVHQAVGAAHAQPAAEPASMLPPPLPLTEQERLLLRLVRHEPTQQLAHLTQPVLDEAFQQGKQQVTDFFAPRPPLPGQQIPPEYDATPGQP